MKKRLFFLSVIILVGVSLLTQGDTDQVTKADKLKAVFIFNFIQYIKWSEEPSDAFVIAILGETDVVTPLKQIAKRKKLPGNRKLKIKELKHVEDINKCQILFIPKSEKDRLDKILKQVEDKNVLTVSENEGFAARGVAINFVKVSEKIKFEINHSAIIRAQLKVGSQLLKLAIFVDEESRKVGNP